MAVQRSAEGSAEAILRFRTQLLVHCLSGCEVTPPCEKIEEKLLLPIAEKRLQMWSNIKSYLITASGCLYCTWQASASIIMRQNLLVVDPLLANCKLPIGSFLDHAPATIHKQMGLLWVKCVLLSPSALRTASPFSAAFRDNKFYSFNAPVRCENWVEDMTLPTQKSAC